MSLPRALGLLFAGLLGALLSTALSALWSGPTPDLTLICALYAGLNCRLLGSPVAMLGDARPEAMAGLGAALGYLMDLLGGTPRGLRALAFAVLLLGLRALASHLSVRGARSVLLATVVFTLVARLLVALLLVLFDGSAGLSGLRCAPGEAMTTAIVAPVGFALLERLDRWLFRDPRQKGLAYEGKNSLR
jgi:hypothetical protein